MARTRLTSAQAYALTSLYYTGLWPRRFQRRSKERLIGLGLVFELPGTVGIWKSSPSRYGTARRDETLHFMWHALTDAGRAAVDSQPHFESNRPLWTLR